MSATPPHTSSMASYSMRRKGERKRSPLSQEPVCAYAFSSKEPSSSDPPSILPILPPTTSPSVEGKDVDSFVNLTDEVEHFYHIALHTRSLRRSASCPLPVLGSSEESLRFQRLLERLAGEYERNEVVDEFLESPDPDALVREFFEFVRETDEAEMPYDTDGDNEEGVEDGELGERRSESDVVRQNDGNGSGLEDKSLYGNLSSSANPSMAMEYEAQNTEDKDDRSVVTEEETIDAENNAGQDTFRHVSDLSDLDRTGTMVVPNVVQAQFEQVPSNDKKERTTQDDASPSSDAESNPFDLEFQPASRTNPFEEEEGYNLKLNDDGSDPFADLSDSYSEEESASYLTNDGSNSFTDLLDDCVLPNISSSEFFTDVLCPSRKANTNPFADSGETSSPITQIEEDPWRDTGDWPPNPFKDFFSPEPEPIAEHGPKTTLRISGFAGPNPFSEAVEAINRAGMKEFGENIDAHLSPEVIDTKDKEKEERDAEMSDISAPPSLQCHVINTDAIRTNPLQEPQEEYPYEVGYFSHAVSITEPYGPYFGYDSVESFSQTVRSNPDNDPMNYYIPEAFWQRNEGNLYEDPTSHQVTESFSETVLPMPESIVPEMDYMSAPPTMLQTPQKFKLRNLWSKKTEPQTVQSHPATSEKPVADTQPVLEMEPELQIQAFCQSGHTHASYDTQQQPTAKHRVRRPPPSPETAEQAPAKLPIRVRIKGTISRLSARILPRKQRLPLPVRAELTQTTPAQPQSALLTPQEAFLISPTSYQSLQRKIVADYMRLPLEVRHRQDYGDELRYGEGVVSGEQTVRRRVDEGRERYRVSERRLQGGMGEGWRGKYRAWWEDGRAGWGTVYRRRGG